MSAANSSRTFFGYLTTWYARFDRPISSLSLVLGFAFDALTLKRVDMIWENVWVGAHLLVVAVCIVLVNRGENEEPMEAENTAKTHFWLLNILQFFFGGLFSTFLVFFFRSGSLWVSWPFYLLLGAAFVANESLKKHSERLDFQIGLFFLALIVFAIFGLPVVLHRMGPGIFLGSGAVSLVLLGLFLSVLKSIGRESFARGRKTLFISIGSIFFAINFLYYLNLIPPLPLSLEDASVVHSLVKDAEGHYVVEQEPKEWLGFFRLAQKFHWAAGTPVYVYSAVFSPASLNMNIVHEWQSYDTKRGWVTTSRVELPVIGGRDGGFRTYSMKTAIRPGAWRVNVETSSGAILGRLRFNIIQQSVDPALQTEYKN